MRGRCDGCRRTTDVQPVSIVRKYSTNKKTGWYSCKKCWDGFGDSEFTVYWPRGD